MTSNNRICHMTTTLINNMPDILKISFVSSNNISLFKSGLISINHLNNALANELCNNLISYNSRKLEWKNILDILTFSAESLIESLSVHMYDDYEKHENKFISSFLKTKQYLFSKPQLDSLVSNTSIFLLKFFTNFYQNQNDFNIKKVKKNGRNKIEVYIPTIEKCFVKGILPSAYHTDIPPNKEKLCDLQFCNITNSDITILLCGHSYHTSCFNNLNFTCNYCFQYYKSSIEKISNNFNTYLKSNKKKYENDREEISSNNIIELDEDNILEDININENNINTEFSLAMNNFITITNENQILTEFRRVSIDFSNNIDQNNIIISNKRKRDSYLTNLIQKK
ncbi:21243_t:CDS:2 [Cetraspora pellucida]|uniref:21243_t:CDS:1 n=1 Tax=Cetraspora pellucida TaxID=1433469 RepID=A0A9N8VXR4_9GLOM|nr:21243_t:CDS:2 [Cetraspora pellucida]